MNRHAKRVDSKKEKFRKGTGEWRTEGKKEGKLQKKNK
jgi:hypothetical protein